jgi:hypothetical protein
LPVGENEIMQRRKFLALAGATLAAQKFPLYAQSSGDATLTLGKSAVRSISPDFIGLGYEMSSPARPGLLSVNNKVYLQLVKQLGARGTLRLGGIVGDHTHYVPNGVAKMDQDNTILTRAALEQLAAFLRATGWQAIWSVNFGNESLEHAIKELRDVASILGNRLLAVEIGNEVENYGKGNPPHRPGGYTYEQYRAEYAVWHKAIAAAVPNLRFAAPDTAKNIEWVEQMAADNAGTVQVLTTHYYRAGQKQAQREQLTVPDPWLVDAVQRLQTASHSSKLPWRMCETNSYSGGGHPGLSDTVLGALWTLDYMLYLATNGCAGVNIETGINQLGFVSSYSPIQDDEHGRNWAGVPYYGMLAARLVLDASPDVLPVHLEGVGPTFTAYALGKSDTAPQAIVLINRSDANDCTVKLQGAHGMHVYRLEGNGQGATLGGASVNAAGVWHPAAHNFVTGTSIKVSRMSAAVLTHRAVPLS